MNLTERLRRIADALPPSGAVTLTRADLLDLLKTDGMSTAGEEGVDLTVDQVAKKLGRAPSTIRNWLAEERLPGAYRLRGREWRIPPATLQSFLQMEAAGRSSPGHRRGRKASVDVGAWRQHVRAS